MLESIVIYSQAVERASRKGTRGVHVAKRTAVLGSAHAEQESGNFEMSYCRRRQDSDRRGSRVYLGRNRPSGLLCEPCTQEMESCKLYCLVSANWPSLPLPPKMKLPVTVIMGATGLVGRLGESDGGIEHRILRLDLTQKSDDTRRSAR